MGKRRRGRKLWHLILYIVLSVVIFICSMYVWEYIKTDEKPPTDSSVTEDSSEELPPGDSSDGEEENEHEHSFWLAKVLQETTCELDGVELWICDCGVSKKEIYTKYGHIGVYLKGYEATCIKAGKTDGVSCETCLSVLLAQEEIAKLGHDYGSDGFCIRCGHDDEENWTKNY